MSLAEIRRFEEDLKLREPLRQRAIDSTKTPSKAGPRSKKLVSQAVAFALSEGFAFSAKEACAYLKAKAAKQGETLTARYIDDLPAQGYFPFVFFSEIYLVRQPSKQTGR